ncbi:hypothetical protein ACQEVI_26760 [Promicromonospora sp. CA-289599]|uniref:hypothetical protein n=1 Tax=Promicromonospora sp. CA-289599 TaxID=3240014 RepID=UPI003D94A821
MDWPIVESVADRVRAWHVKPSLYEWMAPVSTLENSRYLDAVLFAASICHSTKGALRATYVDTRYKGWDVLLRGFVAAAEDGIGPELLRDVDATSLAELVVHGGSETKVEFRDLDRRTEIVRSLARELTGYGNGISDVLQFEGDVLTAGGAGGAYERLASLSAFSDSQQKKSTTFLMTVHFSGRVRMADPESVSPMVDYHRIRLLLRLGCIRVSDELASALRSGDSVDSDVAAHLRSAAYAISTKMSAVSKLPELELDVLLWAFARSACRHSPVCTSQAYQNSSFGAFTGWSASRGCPFAGVCCSEGAAIEGMFWEPIVETENY